MKIGIIDSELLAGVQNRFPNLACMKLAGFHTQQGDDVELIDSINDSPLLINTSLSTYDKIYVSKVFTSTQLPKPLEAFITDNKEKVIVGGTGFFFDKAPPLPDEVEHTKPLYDLYSKYVAKQKNPLSSALKFYRDYSIGFLTRHCFRHCPFCVNQNFNRVKEHSPLNEFVEPSKKKICLCDDNFFGFSGWKRLLEELRSTNKPFVFRQGLDERLLTEEKAQLLFSSKYDGFYTFAFDSIRDYDLIENKLKIIRKYRPTNRIRFYTLVGFESVDVKDIENALLRINLLLTNGCYPYVMRYRGPDHEPWRESPYAGLYQAMANWSCQPSFVYKYTIREFVEAENARLKGTGKNMSALIKLEEDAPHLSRLFDVKLHVV